MFALLFGFVSVAQPIQPAVASETLTTCRPASTGATGDPYERYTSLASRTQDSVTGLQIVPVYAPKLYIDPRSGYDASYIAYRIHNGTGSNLTNLSVTLNGFTASDPVQLANPGDATQTIAKLDNGARDTIYFLISATKATESVSKHAVRVLERTASGTTQLAACEASITAVQRSLAASANKVTKIEVKGSPALGQTLNIEVTGAPGKVPAASISDPYFSVMTLSPTGSARWPTRALRLESSTIVVSGLAQPAVSTCVSSGGVSTGSGSVRAVTWTDTLALRNFGSCATTTKQTYLATYVFRVVGVASSNPVIRPISDISSGQQVKYTGSFPAEETTVPVTAASVSVPITVSKTYVSSSRPVAGSLDVVYRLTATSTGGQVLLDELVDVPDPGGVFVSGSATYTDAVYTNRGIVPSASGGQLRFTGPFEANSVGSKTVTLTYTVRFPDVAASYANSAYGVSGNFVVGSNSAQIDVATVTVSGPGGSVTGATTQTARPGSPQTITFPQLDPLGTGSSVELTGYSDSGLPLTYTVADPTICSASEFDGVWTLVTLSPGNCVVTASQGGGSGFDPATSVTRTIVIKPGQVLDYQITQAFGTGSTATVKVWADSGLTPTLATITPGVCTVGASTSASPPTGALSFTITRGTETGNCYLLANQSGNTDFGPATELEILLGVGKSQTITISAPAVSVTGFDMASVAQFSIAAYTEETGTTTKLAHSITFQTSTPTVCAVTLPIVDGEIGDGYNGTTRTTTLTVTLRGAGTCTIVASQDGYDFEGTLSAYAPAQNVSRSFTITSAGTVTQVLELTTPFATRVYGDASFDLTAASKKTDGAFTNLLVSLSGTSGVCRVGTPSLSAGVTTASLAILSVGTCTVTATQPGDSTYRAATQQTVTITITQKTVTVTGWSVDSKNYDDTRAATLSGTATLSGVVPGDTGSDVNLVGAGSASATFANELPGTRGVTVTGPSLGGTKSGNYLLELPTNLTGEITPRPLTLTAQNQSVGSGNDATVPCVVNASGLLSGHEATSPVCSVAGTAPRAAGDYSIGLSSATIRLTSDVSSDITARYSITYVSGTLTVLAEGLLPVTLDADNLEITYGDSLHTALGALVSSGNPSLDGRGTRIGVLAVNGGSRIPGSLTQTVAGNAVDPAVRYAAATYIITMTFTPTDGDTYGSTTATRQVVINAKPLTISVVAQAKEYDGTSSVTLGTPSLNGVLSGDTVSLSGTLSGSFVSEDVAENVAVTTSGVSLAGTHAANYSLASMPSPTADITPRPLTPIITPRDKTYDGNRTVTFQSTTLPQGGVTGVVARDSASVALAGTLTGAFVSENVGDSVSVTSLAGISLSGARASNYSLVLPSGLTARIIARLITVRVNDEGMLVGDPQPTYSAVVEGTFADGDTSSVIVGTISPRVQGTPNLSVPGTATIEANITGGANSSNYSVVEVNGTLYIGEIEIDVDEVNGELSSLDVECTCAGLKPNASITLVIFSVETQIVTTTTDSNGGCPLLNGSIPGSVGAGPHTLEVRGSLPDDSLAREGRPVVIPASLIPAQVSPSGGSGGGGGGGSSAQSTPIVQPSVITPPPRRVPPGRITPVTPPSTNPVTPPVAPPVVPRNEPPVVTPSLPGLRGLAQPPAPGNGSGSGPTNPGSAFSAQATVDLGVQAPAGNGQQSAGNGQAPAEVNSNSAGRRTVNEMSQERLGGFAPGVSTFIEILGARTAARFVVSDTAQVDQFTLIRAIEASVPAQSANFFAIDSVQPVNQPIVPRAWSPQERAGVTEFFAAAGLTAPQTLADLDLDDYSQWLLVTANSSTYAPGTQVYLTLTSEPLVLASAVVGRDGTASLSGTLPVEFLTAGEHRVRLVGIRALDGVSVDDEGEIQLSSELLSEIERFDLGTQATMAVIGENTQGANHVALRVIPLVPVAPWWTLWLILGGALISLAIRFTPRRTIRVRRIVSIVVGAVALVPSVILGWFSTVTAVVWWGLGLGLAAVALSALGPYRKAQQDEPSSSPRA